MAASCANHLPEQCPLHLRWLREKTIDYSPIATPLMYRWFLSKQQDDLSPLRFVNIRQLQTTDRDAWLAMRSALWPHCTSERHVTEMHHYFSSNGLLATFVAVDSDESHCGFIEASLRPCAEGCTSNPVGYIEGIYVHPDFRRRGIARALVAAAEQWAASHGCVEFASDCHSYNEVSIRFHTSLGFDVTKQLVHFRRAISNASGKA